MIGPEGNHKHDGEHARPKKVRRGHTKRPLRIEYREIEISTCGKGKSGALERDKGGRAPGRRHAGAKAVGRQFRHVLNGALVHCSSSGAPFGQNQPVRAMPSGGAPQTTAHGVKIEAIKMAPVTSAASKGQIDG